ncbi:ABC transporter permease subunit [Enterococcus sp. DIV0242_7C1]|uniref:ABC transporter permease n=1 Tax=Candidatus Enterococcus dunnyi TaxID=1834192 RepID=A0A200JEC2_9ENTE|nr:MULTISPECIES: ABC transporter permease subunit [unclassified Enterococcus]MBO0469726.1 ABC transporter permease subunit [Enterococcus sp. DIV0242_7C1]OUZ34985.1 hypothetical protein A5889_000460 [Enterococcus sp. 9D6_DIV0238]
MNSLVFELKKTWRTRKNYLLLSLFLLLTVVLFCVNTLLEKQEQQEMLASSQVEHQIRNNQYGEAIKVYLEEINQGIVSQEDGFRADADKGISLEGKLTLPTYPFYRTALNQELLKRQLTPQSLRFGTKNSLFTMILCAYVASFIGITCFLFLFGDTLSKELEENSLYFYLSQPINRVRLYLTKYFLVWSQSLLTLILILFAGWIWATIFSGSSSFSYPVIVFTEKSMELIPIIQLLGIVLLLFSFVLGFGFALHFLMSLLLKKTSFSLVGTLLILVEGYLIATSKYDFFRKIAHFNPFTYLNVSKVFVGYDFRPFSLFSIENQEYYAN